MELVVAIKLNLSHEHVRTGDHYPALFDLLHAQGRNLERLLFWDISGNHRMTGKNKNSGIPDEW
jgi:hypothetical protein